MGFCEKIGLFLRFHGAVEFFKMAVASLLLFCRFSEKTWKSVWCNETGRNIALKERATVLACLIVTGQNKSDFICMKHIKGKSTIKCLTIAKWQHSHWNCKPVIESGRGSRQNENQFLWSDRAALTILPKTCRFWQRVAGAFYGLCGFTLPLPFYLSQQIACTAFHSNVSGFFPSFKSR